MTSKLGHTSCGRGGKQADVCEAKHTQIQAREHRHRCACGCPEIPWLLFSWKQLSLRSGFIFMLDFRIPTGDSVFFPFWFLMSLHPVPSTSAVSVSKSAGPSLYTFALTKWKHSELSLSSSHSEGQRGTRGTNLHGKLTFISLVQECMLGALSLESSM